jgi:Lar family restriction alleviation protein
MSDDLKPCPFCGGEAYFAVGKIVDGKYWHYVECVQCGAMGPYVKYADHNIAVKPANALAWNTRTPDPRIEALTEQLEAARADAKEAEAYAEGLERDLKTCRMAQVVMDNTVAEAVKMLDEQDRKYNRMTNDMIERHAAKLAKAVEALVSLEKQASTTSSRGAVTGLHWTHLTVAILKARDTLAELEGKTPYRLEGEKT